MKQVTALRDGFYKGQRVRAGQTFPVDDAAQGRWFVSPAEYEKPIEATEETSPLTMHQLNGRRAGSFVEAMRRKDPKPEATATDKKAKPGKKDPKPEATATGEDSLI